MRSLLIQKFTSEPHFGCEILPCTQTEQTYVLEYNILHIIRKIKDIPFVKLKHNKTVFFLFLEFCHEA